MTAIVKMLPNGILIAETTPEVAAAISALLHDAATGAANYANAAQDIQALYDQIGAMINNNPLGETQVIGSTAYGAAATIAWIEYGVGAAAAEALVAAAAIAGVALSPAIAATAAITVGAVVVGYGASSVYDAAFKDLVTRGELIGEILYDKLHPAQPIIDPVIADLIAQFTQAQQIVSPIVLDLNGDGIATTAVTGGTHFDHDANGFAEATGWVNAQDGILVRDLNGNGTIDSGRELFGSETLLANGQKAANGYQALTELDTNQDGQINALDAAYTTLKIWKDANGDGISQAGELLTLADAGVLSIATGSTAVNQLDANGNTIKQTGTFTKTDGTTGNSADIWFAVNKTRTLATEWLPETAAVAALPDLQGFGNVYDLHQAMLRDGTGHLQGLVQQFANETSLAARHAANDAGLEEWKVA